MPATTRLVYTLVAALLSGSALVTLSADSSAAAVAADETLGALGTDTGGSIRQPASFCGVVGLKPTYGRVSRLGMVAFASSLDQGGPMAKTAEDAALLLQAMAGFDTRDSTCSESPVPDYSATLNDSIEGLKIGLPAEYFDAGLDDGGQGPAHQTLV